MPKETVYGEQRVFDPADENPQVSRVEVLWSRDAGFVQVVTKATDAAGGRWASSYGDEYHVTDGYYVDLTRAEVNHLIRNLRRARDQAFGRDE